MTDDSIVQHRVTPLTMRFVAIGHFTFAVVVLALAFLSGAVENGTLDQGLMKTLNAVDSPQASAMKRTMQRANGVRESLKRHFAVRLPSSVWIGPLGQTVDIGLAVLLFVAGSCLIQKHPWGRPLSIGFAVLFLFAKLAMMSYQILFEIPLAKKYFEPLFRMYPADNSLFHGILDPIANGPIYLMVMAIYPLIVLAVMVQPGAQAASTTRTVAYAPDPELLLPEEAMFQSSVLQSDADDPLAALMQRKSY